MASKQQLTPYYAEELYAVGAGTHPVHEAATVYLATDVTAEIGKLKALLAAAELRVPVGETRAEPTAQSGRCKSMHSIQCTELVGHDGDHCNESITWPNRCDVCHGSGELVFNKHGGDPAYDDSKPCPECSAPKTPAELLNCGPGTPWDRLCGEPSCAYCGAPRIPKEPQ